MCGIAGIYLKDKATGLRPTIQKMIDVIPHRGPDGEGVFLEEDQIALGHRRLSIIDVDKRSDQPLYSSCGNYILVFNGEIYNYKSIKQELGNFEFSTTSDTEVLLNAYIQWGVNCLEKFNGMFSLAIYNKKDKSLFVARDRLGIKPLYYTHTDKGLAISSEVKQLIASGYASTQLDRKGLVQYFMNKTVYTPNTILKDVKMLPAGHYMLYSGEQLDIQPYWNILEKRESKRVATTYEQTKEDVRELLLDSVNLRMVSDVPLGAFLSGGIDSSIIVGLASQHSQVNTVSICFDEEKYDESEYSRLIAKKFKTNHTEVRFKPEALLEKLPSIMKALDHPSIDGVNTHFVSEKAKENGLTVSLSGLGGDELFAGYYYFKWGYNYKKYIEKLPSAGKFLKNVVGKTALGLKENVSTHKLKEYLNASKDFQSKYHIFRQLYFSHQLNDLFSFDPQSYDYPRADDALLKQFPKLSQFSYLELTTYMEHVLLRDTDQMSMDSSLEVRVPFLDHRLVEYVMNIDDKFKYPSFPKKLLVESVGDLLPEAIYNRKKMGFNFPWEYWLRNELKDYVDEKISSLAARPEFNEESIRSIWQNFLDHKAGVSFSRVWLYVALECTLQNYGA